jgi:hypothetical protein
MVLKKIGWLELSGYRLYRDESRLDWKKLKSQKIQKIYIFVMHFHLHQIGGKNWNQLIDWTLSCLIIDQKSAVVRKMKMTTPNIHIHVTACVVPKNPLALTNNEVHSIQWSKQISPNTTLFNWTIFVCIALGQLSYIMGVHAMSLMTHWHLSAWSVSALPWWFTVVYSALP